MVIPLSQGGGVKPIRYVNHAEFHFPSGNRRPIRYHFHSGVKAIRYSGNNVLIEFALRTRSIKHFK